MLGAFEKKLLRDFPLGFVATVTAGLDPAVSPKGTFLALGDRTIGFAEIRSPGTLANLKHAPEAEVCFVDPFLRKGFRARGVARILGQGTEEFAELVTKWAEIWPNLVSRIRALVLLDLNEVKPLSTPPYDDGATEEEMVALYKRKYSEIYP